MTTAVASKASGGSKTSGGFKNASQSTGGPYNNPAPRNGGHSVANGNYQRRSDAPSPQRQPQRQDAFRERSNSQGNGRSNKSGSPSGANKRSKPPADHPILFQKFFKSVGPRTYVAQIKKAGNGNHYLVLTEANRKKDTDEVRKTRLFLFSEDFAAFFDLLRDTQNFITSNPVDSEVSKKQSEYWQKQNRSQNRPASG